MTKENVLYFHLRYLLIQLEEFEPACASNLFAFQTGHRHWFDWLVGITCFKYHHVVAVNAYLSGEEGAGGERQLWAGGGGTLLPIFALFS